MNRKVYGKKWPWLNFSYSSCLPGGTEERYENSVSLYSASGPRFEPKIPEYDAGV
jgi:hypothetical protein